MHLPGKFYKEMFMKPLRVHLQDKYCSHVSGAEAVWESKYVSVMYFPRIFITSENSRLTYG